MTEETSSSYKIGKPFIQILGFQGEEFLIRIAFPVREEFNMKEEDGATWQPSEGPEIGKRGIILKFKAEDLPMHPLGGNLLHFDLGPAMRERFAIEEKHE